MNTLTKESFAAMLNGREMGNEITDQEERDAKAAGLVAIFGYSDDNMELRGVIRNEVGCSDGGTLKLTANGVVPEWNDHEEKTKREALEWMALQSLPSAEIKAVWGVGDYSWTYETAIPHATFEIMEEGEKFCCGIVFSITDLTL